jgi:hypothetical protein
VQPPICSFAEIEAQAGLVVIEQLAQAVTRERLV